MICREEVEKFSPDTHTVYDVIVAGGGPAGLGAAIAASINGARTLLLEGRSFLGGVAAVCLWMPMNRLLTNGASRGGVHDIFVQKLKSYGNDACVQGATNSIDDDNLDIHPDYLRLATYELLEEYGCHYRLHSPVTDVVMEGNSIKKVVTTSKEGRTEFAAKTFIDATGDGDVAFYAGAPMSQGRENDGAFMPVTLCFAVMNVDVERFIEYINQESAQFYSIINDASQKYCVAGWYSIARTTLPGVISVNNGGPRDVGIINATQLNDLNVSERLGIQLAVDFIKIAKEYQIPGLENCCLMRTGATVGVRETRRIIGDYVLTIEDCCEGTGFPDIVSRRYGAIDPGGLSEGKDFHHTMKSGHGYPYRAMLPLGIENLLVAGRCGSMTHLAQTAGKSMGNMMGLGQAAGVAAALCAKHNTTARKIDVHELQAILKKMGVSL